MLPQKNSSKKTISNGLKKIKHFILNKTNLWGILVLCCTFLLMIDAIYLWYVLENNFDQFNIERVQSKLGVTFTAIATSLFIFKVIFFLYTLFRFFKYKPIAPVEDNELPTCTVIVPAYNEGKQVWDTLISLANSDYPKNKLNLIAIDDGSQDDTWKWMQDAKTDLGDILSIYKQPKNKGKRHALYRGFNIAKSDIFVTVDSDSVVNPDTLKHLVSPFVVDKQCGAVAGNIKVLNNKEALLPKMLNVSFTLSFEFVRSAESSLNAVLCTPGALAAYKSSAVFACLPEWINQKFMGQPSDIGEDRAMTNMILKQGHHVLFQKHAIAYTKVPEHYIGLYKMFIRWARSNVRENIEMFKYVFKNFRAGKKSGTRLLFINQSLIILTSYPFLFFMLFFAFTQPILFLSSTFVSIVVLSTFTVLFYAKNYNIKESFWAYTYSILYTFGLFWVTPYAIITANKRGWLTRGLPEKK